MLCCLKMSLPLSSTTQKPMRNEVYVVTSFIHSVLYFSFWKEITILYLLCILVADRANYDFSVLGGHRRTKTRFLKWAFSWAQVQ